MTQNDSSISVDRELDWDIREGVIEQIQEDYSRTRNSQREAVYYRDIKHLRIYHAQLVTLLQDCLPYIQKFTDRDTKENFDTLIEIDGKLQEPDVVNTGQVLAELLRIDQEINDKRIESGLDIPVRENIEYGQGRGDNE